jgi:hypothetical protein
MPAFDAAVTFTGPGSGAPMRMLLDDLEQGGAGALRQRLSLNARRLC